MDVGCGGGWLAHGLALHHGLRVDALDFTPEPLEQARALAPLLGTVPLVRFREERSAQSCSPSESSTPGRGGDVRCKRTGNALESSTINGPLGP